MEIGSCSKRVVYNTQCIINEKRGLEQNGNRNVVKKRKNEDNFIKFYCNIVLLYYAANLHKKKK